ncbi:MAG TPA: site-specific DNA-methyltransferase [Microbacteriaceae bacterium]|jgi:DNA modification methylase|nr:site-specific DNA-methyltransferase [Microbacteriaceae bacterium]
MTPRNLVLEGDAFEVLRTLATSSIECAITSPPYFQARHYGAGERELGREHHVDAWVGSLRAVSEEVARVLVPTGSYWLNVGDLYSRHERLGASPKSLLLGPERLVRGLLEDGWIVRNRVAWVKSVPLPSPVTDRLTNGWEYVFHLVRQRDYFYDLDAIRLPLVTRRPSRTLSKAPAAALGALANHRSGLDHLAREGRAGHPLGRNPTDVWTLPPGRHVGGHFATFPEALVRRPILATAPSKVCTSCGRPWRRSKRRVTFLAGTPQSRPFVPCGCNAATRPGLVLDPFAGSGTTLRVARDLGRDVLGIELHPGYAQLARERAGLEMTRATAT